MHGAPVVPVAPAVDVPLGILPALTLAVAVIRIVGVGHGRRRDHSGTANSLVRPMCWGVGSRRSAAAELADPAHQALQQLPCRAATADRAGKRIHHVRAVAVLGVVVEFGELLLRLTTRVVGAGHIRLLRAWVRRQQAAGLDHTEAGRWIGNLAASGHVQRRCRRIGPGREVEIDQRPHGQRQQILIRRQRALAFDGEIFLGQRRTAKQLAHHIGLESTAREQRRLHGHRLQLLTRALGRVDEDGDAVRPSGVAPVSRCDRDRAAGQRGRQQSQSLWTVVIDGR